MADEIIEMEFRLKNYVTAEINRMSEQFRNTERQAKKTGDAISSMASGAKQLAGALGLAFGVSQVKRFFDESLRGAKEQIQMEAKLTSALGYRSEALLKNASALQALTIHGDEEIINAQSLIANFIREESIINRLLPAIIDMADAKQINLASAADLVTKSVASETNALARYGIQITGAAGSTERANSAIKALNRAFGGTGQALAQTDVGKIQQTVNLIGDIKEEIGNNLIPIQKEYYQLVLDTLEGWKQISKWIGLSGQDEKTATKEQGIKTATIDNLKRMRTETQKIIDQQKMNQRAGAFSVLGALFNPKELAEAEAKIIRINESIAKLGGQPPSSGSEKGKGGGMPSGGKFDRTAWEEELRKVTLYLETEQLQQRQTEIDADVKLYMDKVKLRQKANEQLQQLDESMNDHKQKMRDIDLQREERSNATKKQAAEWVASEFAQTIGMIGQAAKVGAVQQKRISQVQAIINTAVAASKANTATPYPPVNAGLMVMAIAQGMAQVAIIERQKFAGGGIVPGTSFSGDRVPVSVNSGEMILNKQQQSNLFDMIKGSRSSGSFSIVINAAPGANVDRVAVDNLRETLVSEIGPALIEAGERGLLDKWRTVAG